MECRLPLRHGIGAGAATPIIMNRKQQKCMKMIHKQRHYVAENENATLRRGKQKRHYVAHSNTTLLKRADFKHIMTQRDAKEQHGTTPHADKKKERTLRPVQHYAAKLQPALCRVPLKAVRLSKNSERAIQI